ncbi:MAG: S8 family serine peptidase, partial [candidate division Zixibacteria bacterium]
MNTNVKNIGLLAIALIVMSLSLSAYAGESASEFVPEEIVCQVAYPEYIDSVNIAYGTSISQYLLQIDGYLLTTLPGQNAESLAAVIDLLPDVIYCQANYLLDAPEPVQGSQPFTDIGGTGDASTQEAATTLKLPATHEVSTGTGVKVAVIDVGVELNHPMFSGMTVSGADYVDGDAVAMDESGGRASGHGTFVAGIVSVVAPAAEIVAYRVLDTTGSGNGFSIAEAVLQAVSDGCKVINLSIVMTGAHSTLDGAIEFAHANDVMVIAAAGNDSSNSDLFPARDSYTLSVAALDSSNLKADFSSYGGKVDVCAPGTGIYSAYLDSSFAWWDGTSFAAPFVSGVAALLYSIDSSASWSEIRDAIEETAISVDSINPDYANQLGFGLIDPVAALQQIGATCGDISGDGTGPDISDLTALVNYLFITFVLPGSPVASDV